MKVIDSSALIKYVAKEENQTKSQLYRMRPAKYSTTITTDANPENDHTHQT